MKIRPVLPVAALLIGGASVFALVQSSEKRHGGPQADGGFVVSTEQRIEPGAIAFDGRPVDLALHPSGQFAAVLNQNNVLLVNRTGVLEGSAAKLPDGAGYRGILWTPDGTRLFASVSNGVIQSFTYANGKLTPGVVLHPAPDGAKGNPRPGGMTVTRDGKHLFAAACDRGSVVEFDLTTDKFVREYKVQNLPFEVKLSPDEKTLLVTNWGGRLPKEDDDKAQSGDAMIVVNKRGAAATGTLSFVAHDSGGTTTVPVGIHPTALLVAGNRVYVACAGSDSISEIHLEARRVLRTLPLKWGQMNLFGSMPCALALHDKTLYVCSGGDNAVCEMDIASGQVRGFRPAGFFPMSITLTADGKTAFVVNTKGNGSVRRTAKGGPGNAHDFQGTVSVLDLSADLTKATARVAENNGWNRDRTALRPALKVYNGGIKHVLYIIKENRTYDEVFGDMPQGNGDPKLCGLGENITPNHHALARAFTLFDNGYVSGTNSADGHAWSTQALANDYLEHFYTGYRTYPDDGDCAMAISNGGGLWDAALAKGKTLRIYGEFCDDDLATFTPKPNDWLDVWKDRKSGANKIVPHVDTRLPHLKKYIHPHYVYWPLLQSDQARADLFIEEYTRFSRADTVPNLMILSLPCDHTEGRDPHYPKPQSMIADNDLALGRIVEAVSKSPQWKETCIFVIEDDAQSGPDHVDGHRTVFAAYSPYVRRGYVDSTMYNTVSILRSIELMLGLDPMNRFDALTPPLSACFTDTPNFAPFASVPNRIALDEMNPKPAALTGKELYWTQRSLALDWSGMDKPDPQILNRVLWHTLHGVNAPYPMP